MSLGLTLALDGSTYAGSVALIRGREVIAERQLDSAPKPGKAGREENFMPMVADCLRDGKVAASALSRVVCGAGPGSFTSLRVAASIAKGISVGAAIPLFEVSSLLLVLTRVPRANGLWLCALPAMRGELFAALYESIDGSIRPMGDARIIDGTDLEGEAERFSATVIGPIANEEDTPHARGAAAVLDAIIASGPCDINAWEPTYGRLAEAQVKWEAAHGRPLSAAG